MVKTGYISFITKTGGGQDADGNPVTPVNTLSDYIECNLKTVKKEYRLITDAQYSQAKYICYIVASLVSSLSIDLETIKEVQIHDNNNNDLGTFQIQNVEYLNLTKRVKLVV